jgi:3-oxoisoapionate kinase
LPPLYTFYGDDFTGSTDVLEQLSANGVPSVLFLAPPTPQQLQQFPNVLAFGIAGDSRSRPPDWMNQNLPPIFQSLQNFGAPIVHYKVCSTFDSSPTHGSIGRAIELGLAAIAPRFVPIVVGAPHLRRFVFEGKLFASAPDGMIHRIDRHPMSHHPVTPMREPALRHHLAKQTSLPIGFLDHRHLHKLAAASTELNAQIAAGNRAILFDTTDLQSLHIIGNLLWELAQEQPLFSASSSGLTTALIAAWREQNLIPPPPPKTPIPPAAPLLILSGSCSPATARQINWVLDQGFHGVRIDPDLLLSPTTSTAYRSVLLDETAAHLNRNRDTVIYTALGTTTSPIAGDALGKALGSILTELLSRTSITRTVLCGGDTSSHAVQQLGLTALTWAASLQPGAPLCRAHSASPTARPLELVLKGGQVGTEDFFAIARGGA